MKKFQIQQQCNSNKVQFTLKCGLVSLQIVTVHHREVVKW